jgi:hypothetical protein
MKTANILHVSASFGDAGFRNPIAVFRNRVAAMGDTD